MANTNYLGVDGNWTNAANWSGGAAPADTNQINIDNTSTSITSNHTATGLDNVVLTIGPRYTGSIGASGSALGLTGGTGNNVVYFRGKLCPAAYIAATTGSNNVLFVEATSATANALVISGTWATVYITGGQSVTIAGATITNLYVLGSANVTIQSGSTVTNLYVFAGQVIDAVAHTLAEVHGGTLTLDTQNAVTWTTCAVYGGVLRFFGKDCTVSTLTAKGGVFTMNDGQSSFRVVSAGTVFPGANVDTRCGGIASVTLTNLGGKLKRDSNATVTETIGELEPGSL